MSHSSPSSTSDLALPSNLHELETRLRARLGAALESLRGELPAVDAAELALGAVPDAALGDLALGCFPLRGRLGALDEKARVNPGAIAQALTAALLPGDVLAEARAAGPYVNLRYDTASLAHASIGAALAPQGFGTDFATTPEHVVIEFSAPNTNKPQHLGHLRNNVLGHSVSQLLAHAGHRVTRVNLVNDRGIHICKSMLAWQLWGDGVTPDKAGKKGDHLIGDFYVLFDQKFGAEYAAWGESDEGRARYAQWLESEDGIKAQRAVEAYQRAQAAAQTGAGPADGKKGAKKPPKEPKDPRRVFMDNFKDEYFNTLSPLGAQARELLRRWEDGDPQVLEVWRTLNGWVLDGFEATYSRMGITFEHTYFESNTWKLGKEIVEKGLERGVFRTRDDGAVVFDLDRIGLSGEKVVLRSDGTTVYITQDLGTALARRDELGYERMIYVVADEQNYHFQVLFGVLGELEPELKGRFEHLAYGLVNLPHGRMKSREGTVVDADDLMDELARLARHEIDTKIGGEHYAGVSEDEIVRRAEALAQAALKYFLLDVNPRTTMTFNPEKSIDVQGRTGVYCLYNYARTRSLVRKAGGAPPRDALGVLGRLGTPEERRIMLTLADWPRVVRWAADDRDPGKIAEFLFNLCKAFAVMFTDKTNHPIATCADAELRAARLLMAEAVGATLGTGLRLLGIETLEEM